MKRADFLKQKADGLKTRMGGVIPGVRAIFRGYDLHTDLKEMDWLELYLYGITGRRFSSEQMQLFHAMIVYTSYPDARIWNNRVAALAGSSRSTGALGISASLAVSESSIYGRGVDIHAIDFLKRTKVAMDNGAELADCVQKELKEQRRIAGYGRPITSGDERIKPILTLAASLGFDNGPHVRLAHDIEKYLISGRWRMQMNYGAISAALSADLGFSIKEHYLFAYPCFLAGIPPCYIEAAEERPEGSTFPLSCSHITYEGTEKRSWS
jgi:hypothetical protein